MKTKLICEKCERTFNRYKLPSSKHDFCSYACFQQYRYDKTLNHNFFEDINDEEKAYWVGFLLADGNISNTSRKQKSITLALSSKDENHVQKFADIFAVSVRKYKREDYTETCVCSITSKKMWNDLYNKGFLPCKTFIDDDKIFNFIPNRLEKDFIRGFFDGDGGISINKKTKGICFHIIGTEKILLKIKGCIVQNTFIKNVNLFSKKNIEDMFVLEWSGIQQLEVIRKYLYNNAHVYLDRKFDRFQIIKKRYEKFLLNRKIDFRGISISGHKFSAQIYDNGKLHYLGTHNTATAAAKAYDKALIKFEKPLYRLNFPVVK